VSAADAAREATKAFDESVDFNGWRNKQPEAKAA
jgi:hypothetical protein